MSNGHFVVRNKWFILGLLFLFVNSYAMWLYRTSLKDGRGLRAELVVPRDGRVSGQDVLRWRFSGDMVSPSATGVWSAAGPVQFFPDVPGSFCWAAPRELTFRPDGQWKPCSDFKMMFGNDVRGADLQPLIDGMLFNIRSDSLTLKGVSQTDFSESEGLRVMLEFSAEVSPTAVRVALSITNAAGQAVAYQIQQQACGKTMPVIIPCDSSNDITLSLCAGLQSTAGPHGLEQAVSWSIKPARELRVVQVTSEIKPFGPNSIFVSFNRPVSMESVGDFVKVSPPMEISVEAGSQYYWQSENSFRIIGDFKPNTSYTVTLLQGLPGSGGTSLEQDVTHIAYLPDAAVGLEITASGNYMSPQGKMELPFRTVGMTKCHVTLRRVYANNLVYLATRKAQFQNYECWGGSPDDGLSHELVEQDIIIAKDHSEIVEHRLALRELTGGQQGAFYVLITGTNGKDSQQDEYHVIISDTGLSVKKSATEIIVWANSIRTLEPVAGAAVKVFSAENQELLSATTDSDGLARFLFETNGISGTPFLITAQKNDDITCLALARTELDVKGGAGDRDFLVEGYEAYLFTDRGIYRPGETTHLKAIVRGKDTTCPPPFPVQLNIYRPDNRLEKSMTTMLTAYGTAEFDIAWPDFTGTGQYRLDLALPAGKQALGNTHIAVEEFVPPQIRVEIKTAPERRKAGDTIVADVCAAYLFGRPAAGLASELRCELVAQPIVFAQFPGFEFGDPVKPFKNIQQLVGKAALDDSGQARYSVSIPPGKIYPPAALKLIIMGTVVEIGGRSVTSYISREIDVYPFYIGLKRGSEEISVGGKHMFDAIAVNPDGTITSVVARLKLTVEKLTWTTVLRKGSGNSYTYSSEQQATRVHAESVALNDGQFSAAFTPASAGEYRMSLSDPASGASSTIKFYASAPGQSWATRSMAAPDVVELKFDKERYVAGETATLIIKAPFPGKALVTIESVHVLSHQVMLLEKNTAELKFIVKPEYAPNVYCAVTLIRPAVSEKLWGQHRAAGLIPLVVDKPKKKARIILGAPDTIRPRQKLDVAIEITDSESHGLPCEVVLAAVDEGICALTDFKLPDPYGYFMATRRPGSKLYDIYSLLMPELEQSIGDEVSSPGGDVMAGLNRRLNPIKTRRFKPTALWSSTVMTDNNGRAQVQFDIPEFTGQLRLMAVAVDKQHFATTEKKLAVLRPIVVLSSLPRFLAPSDSFSMPVQIMNETGAGGEAVVRVTCTGPLVLAGGSNSAVRRIAMQQGSVTNIAFGLKAQPTPGKAMCLLEVDMAGEHFAEEVELPVRPPAGLATMTGTGRLAKGGGMTLDIPAQWLEGTGKTDIWLASLPAVELGGSLAYLLNYPYGCLEQTTSKSFPLLYLSDLVGQTQAVSLDYKAVSNLVQTGIHRILGMQRDDGAFSMWGYGEAYAWGSIYATHFLVAAGKAGYQVPEERVKSACDYLEQWMAQKTVPDNNVWAGDDLYDRSYACYVLAFADRPQHSWMIRLRERAANLDQDAKVNLGAALVASGKRRDGNALLGTIEIANVKELVRQAGGSLRSDVRNDAMLLATWLELDPGNASIPGLVHRLEAGRENGRWQTTQENAQALMALGRYCNLLAKDTKPITGRITGSGMQTVEFADRQEYHLPLEKTTGGQVAISNLGEGPIYYYWKSEGVPIDGKVQEEDRGLKVRRELLDLTGSNLAPDKLQQGDLLVMQVTLETMGTAAVANIIVDDLLPAGLEIENANLKTAQGVSWCKDKQSLPLLHTDIRDDRMIAFPDQFSGTNVYFYAVRAVTPGEFVMPAIMATCMYDPGIRSVHGAGRISVGIDSK